MAEIITKQLEIVEGGGEVNNPVSVFWTGIQHLSSKTTVKVEEIGDASVEFSLGALGPYKKYNFILNKHLNLTMPISIKEQDSTKTKLCLYGLQTNQQCRAIWMNE